MAFAEQLCNSCLALALGSFLVTSCSEQKQEAVPPPVHWNWKSQTLDYNLSDSLSVGRTYLSVYSEIYSNTDHRIFHLTSTISIRNTSMKDTLFLLAADLYDPEGVKIEEYVEAPVYLSPLETVDIVVEGGSEGGTGGNFIFEWAIGNNVPEPLFEGIMISSSGQQGLSFATKGVRIE